MATKQASRFWHSVRRFERALILRALRRSGGNVSEAARDLELDRVTLIRKIAVLRLRNRRRRKRGRPKKL